jgi:hypothetical protein
MNTEGGATCPWLWCVGFTVLNHLEGWRPRPREKEERQGWRNSGVGVAGGSKPSRSCAACVHAGVCGGGGQRAEGGRRSIMQGGEPMPTQWWG